MNQELGDLEYLFAVDKEIMNRSELYRLIELLQELCLIQQEDNLRLMKKQETRLK